LDAGITRESHHHVVVDVWAIRRAGGVLRLHWVRTMPSMMVIAGLFTLMPGRIMHEVMFGSQTLAGMQT
jgi:uncharacterized membrane protein